MQSRVGNLPWAGWRGAGEGENYFFWGKQHTSCEFPQKAGDKWVLSLAILGHSLSLNKGRLQRSLSAGDS